MKLNYITSFFKNILFLSFFIVFAVPANSELSVEEIIKGRKAIFSKNYNTAKRVQSLSVSGDFEEAKELMKEMSENYKDLFNYFPENSKEGFKTESLPAIWENKDEFNVLMNKSVNDMIELASIIETTDNVKGSLGKLMWSNCKACHSKFRAQH
jgi:cytochrome c556